MFAKPTPDIWFFATKKLSKGILKKMKKIKRGGKKMTDFSKEDTDAYYNVHEIEYDR